MRPARWRAYPRELALIAGELLSTDVSPEMVERLRRRITDADLPNVQCAVMSAYELDAPDASFDVVFCANALHVMDNPTGALAEFRRVLRDDGVLIAPTFLHGVDGFRRALSRVLSAVSPFVAHTRFDLATLEETVILAGFDIVEADEMPGLFPLGYVVARPISTQQSSSQRSRHGSD